MAKLPNEFKALIENLKCELRETALYTEADIAALDLCLIESNSLPSENIPDAVLPEVENLGPCMDQLNGVIDKAKENLTQAMKLKIVASKVQELYDNLSMVALYYQTRYETFNTYAKDSTVLVVQRDVLTQQLAAAKSQDEKKALTDKINAVNSKISQLQNGSKILSDKNFSALNFLSSDEFTSNLTGVLKKYSSNKSSDLFNPIQVQAASGSQQFNFILNLPQLRKYEYKDPETDETVTLDIVSYLNNKKLFNSTPVFVLKAYEDQPLPLKTKLTDVYDNMAGLLYVNDNAGEYPGLYWKLQKPLDRLFTLEERGLTADPSQIDSSFETTPSAAIVQDEDTKYYIHDVDVYQDFYQHLNQNIDDRIKHERTVVFPEAIKDVTAFVKEAANREALYFLRINGIFQQTILGLKVTTDVNASNSITTDTDKITTSKGTLETTLEKFRAISEEINNKLQDIQTELDALTKSSNNLIVTQDALTEQINLIPCFKPKEDLGSCGDVQAALGSDPLGANMIAGTSGPSSTYPDFTTMCYWKEWAKCATLVGLIPLPGDRFTNPFKLRYWPVGLWIPTPVKIIHIPLPHIWIPIFCTSTPVGTIVIFIALCGMVPSPFVFYISPGGSKSFVLSLKGPQKEMGYTVEGTTMSSDGKKGPLLKDKIRIPIPFSTAPKTLNLNFPHNPSEVGFNMGSDADAIHQMDNPEKVQNYLDEFQSKATKQLDTIGDLPMKAFTSARIGNKGDFSKLDMSTKLKIVQKDLIDAVDSLNLGSITVPRDQGKLRMKKPALSSVTGFFQYFAQTGEKLSDEAHFSVRNILSTFIAQIDNGIELPKNVISKDGNKVTKNLKDKLKAFNNQLFNLAKGKSAVPLATDDFLYNNRDTIVGGFAQKEAYKDQYVGLLAFTISSILVGATLDLFNPFKKCCQAKKFQLPKSISPIALVVLDASKVTLDNIIDALTNEELSIIDRASTAGLGEIKSIFNSLILPKFPNTRIPNNVNIFNFSTILAFVGPVLSLISIPQVAINALPLLPGAITFEVDKILKAAIKNLIGSATQITNVLNLNLATQFAQLTSNDLKAVIKKFINSALSTVKSALQIVLAPIQLIKGSNGASKTILDAMFPIMNAVAEAKAVAKSLKKPSQLIEFTDLTKLAAVAATELKLAQKIFKSGASFIPIIVLAALELRAQARLAHPLYNQDDLPSWERLTVKNPLFTLFLDEFCSKAADCTAVILGRTWP